MSENRQKVIEALKKELAFEEQHEHSHFEMSHWVDAIDEQIYYNKERPTLCKTSACIAGTAGLLLAPERVWQWVPPEETEGRGYWEIGLSISWEQLGAELLELDSSTADALFFKSRWPEFAWADDRNSDLEVAIWMLEEIDNGNLEYGWGGWTHPDYPTDEDEDEDEEWEDEDDEDDED